jgi:hypothetical protein
VEGRGPVARTRCGKAGSGLRAGTRLSQALQHVRANARQDREKSRMVCHDGAFVLEVAMLYER